jgi:Zn-dependent M28 family amino/carboxypeptidase
VNFILLLVLLFILTMGVVACGSKQDKPNERMQFDSERAWQDVSYQVSLGARTPGSAAHKQTIDWVIETLRNSGWQVEIQEAQQMGHPLTNITAIYGEGAPIILIGAHYDSRMIADKDPNPQNNNLPVPGANDGASGVAVLLELARTLPSLYSGTGQIRLVFLDGEDNGNFPGWDWILGSKAYVEGLEVVPNAVVIVDMIGDADLNIYQEKNSDPILTEEIWAAAKSMGYENQFIPASKYRIIDDHMPFLEAGIPAVDLIDFDYPFYHTIADTPDKVSGESLRIVGDTLIKWLTLRGLLR